jgi:hypothetical protein
VGEEGRGPRDQITLRPQHPVFLRRNCTSSSRPAFVSSGRSPTSTWSAASQFRRHDSQIFRSRAACSIGYLRLPSSSSSRASTTARRRNSRRVRSRHLGLLPAASAANARCPGNRGNFSDWYVVKGGTDAGRLLGPLCSGSRQASRHTSNGGCEMPQCPPGGRLPRDRRSGTARGRPCRPACSPRLASESERNGDQDDQGGAE